MPRLRQVPRSEATSEVVQAMDKIEAIKAWQVPDQFELLERAVLAHADHLVLGHDRVPDAVFDVLTDNLSDEAIMELTYITMMSSMHAVISRALRLEFDDRDDPIVEVAAPEGYVARKLGRDIALDLRS